MNPHYANMNPHKWLSNDSSVLAEIPTNRRGLTVNVPTGDIPLKKVLGVAWDPVGDVFQPYSGSTEPPCKLTLRSVLSITSSMFDPISLISPIIVTARLIAHELYRQKLNMDEVISDEHFRNWSKSLVGVSDLIFPRRLNPSD